jgi:glycerol-3-phosphate dehydrogenase
MQRVNLRAGPEVALSQALHLSHLLAQIHRVQEVLVAVAHHSFQIVMKKLLRKEMKNKKRKSICCK